MATNEIETFLKTIVDGLAAGTRLDRSTSVTNLPAREASSLIAAIAADPDGHSSSLQVMDQVSRSNSAPQSVVRPDSSSDTGRIAAELTEMRRSLAQNPSSPSQPATTSAAGQPENGSSTAETVFKAIGMATGIGPIAAGLMALFGSRSSSEQPLSTVPFELPTPVSIDAGLTTDRQFTNVMYAADGTPRSVASQPSSSAEGRSATAPIQINVQAMDSRSFLDHSDEIARAVRSAMLHSHSLNDVVAEL
jgi:hypothetical protein